MFDRFLHPRSGRLMDQFARPLARAGVSADAMSMIGFAIGAAALPLLAAGKFTAALAFILANRACDGLDGALARANGPTARGAFLDSVCDFLFYALIPLGFALADPAANALPAAVLLTSFMGTAASFLALAATAASRGMPAASDFPTKGIYYIGGLTEGFETIIVFAAVCLWPAAFPALAYAFAALCTLTTLMRVNWGLRVLAGK